MAKEGLPGVVSGTREEHSVLQGVKSGGLEGNSGKKWTSRGGELGEEHSVLQGVKSGRLEGIIGQIGVIRALSWGNSYSTESVQG